MPSFAKSKKEKEERGEKKKKRYLAQPHRDNIDHGGK